ncbi:MAG: tRNA (N(6)-L-threonylcarbamoyladenosine(37)-C(2))-methylthiotransferase [Candidatus Aenigmarchaeota archaeon]|nr:tRNA (N(6)-L-threonylcarbamoyladenosine(37)-C(2))-methylthiotransferase [Candidatus Aenigmarchaeota archaeon]
MKIYIETYGCSANQADSEMMAGLLEESGHRITNEKDSDIIILNTCFVKTPTEMKIIDRIKKLKGKKLIIAGCMPETMGKKLKKIAPESSLVGTHNLKRITEAVERMMREEAVEFVGKNNVPKAGIKKIRKNPIINIVPVSSGCLGECAYCCVRLAKGRLFSFSGEMIIRDICSSLKDGCREVWITSQDNGCYGFDKGTNLAKLLEETVRIDGDFRIRIGMMNPDHVRRFLRDLINIYKNPKIYKFLHIPVQSGSDSVLKRMKRKYTVKQFEEIVKEFRKEIPDITVSTDIIVGFPGETEKDFEETKKLLERVSPDVVNLSKFGSRPGTEASGMDQVDNRTIKERSKSIGLIIKKITKERNDRFAGKECEILISENGKRKNQWVGRNIEYKPVLVESKDDLLGKMIKVRTSEAKVTHLVGERV